MRQYAIKSFLKDIKQSFVTTSCETNNFSIHTVDTIRITPFSAYVCTELIFDSQLFLCIKIFLKKVLRKLAVHIFTFLLAPFTSKLVNYSRHSESLNIFENQQIAAVEGKCRRCRNTSKCFMIHCANLDVKGAKRNIKMWTTNFYWSFS